MPATCRPLGDVHRLWEVCVDSILTRWVRLHQKVAYDLRGLLGCRCLGMRSFKASLAGSMGPLIGCLACVCSSASAWWWGSLWPGVCGGVGGSCFVLVLLKATQGSPCSRLGADGEDHSCVRGSLSASSMATYETLASPWQHVHHPLGGSAVTPAKKSDAGRSSPSPPTTHRPKRIVAATDFETSVKGAVLGSDLEKQLTLLKSGEGGRSVPP